MNELAYATLGAAIVATFTWPEIVVTIVVGLAMFLVVGCIGVVIWERVWTKRNDLARDRQARDDKAVRTWMDRGAA